MDMKEKIKTAEKRIEELQFLIKEWKKQLPEENNDGTK